MKFEVRYPTGSPHEVTLQGTVAILGRDPSCDLVLNDPKCSRRHAVLEAGPQGITIRDTGSANGVNVNGQKVERAGLKPGDQVRLGDVVLMVLPEDMPGTVVMGPEDMEEFAAGRAPAGKAPSPAATAPPRPAAAPPPPPSPPPAARPPAVTRPPASPASEQVTAAVPAMAPPPPQPQPQPPPPPPPRPRPAPPPPLAEEARAMARAEGAEAGPVLRPLGVTTLAILWMLGVPFYAAAGLGLAMLGGTHGAVAITEVGLGVFLAVLSGIMAAGLWSRSPWARTLQMALAGLGVLTCFFTPVSIAILAYMLRSEMKVHFSDLQDLDDLAPEEAAAVRKDASGLAFTLVILATLLLGMLFAGGASVLARGWMASLFGAQDAVRESAAIARLRTMASAQEAFRSGTCDGYADLDGLLNPSEVIPHYPKSGPTFLPAEFSEAEQAGYRFELRVDDPMATASEGCPSRSFRRYVYSASPLSGDARHFLIGPDGVLRAAAGRPAIAEDPPVE